MAFSVFVEILNLRVRHLEVAPVKLRKPYVEEPQPSEMKKTDQAQ